jgi:hypothetical protein
LYPFDYDGESWGGINNVNGAVGFGAYGYCQGALPAAFNYAENPMRDCKFLFDVCECPDSCEVKPGTTLGIQMIVDVDGDYTTDDGVYFADPSMQTIWFDIQRNSNTYCQRTGEDRPGYSSMSNGFVYYDLFGNRVPYIKDADHPNSTVEQVRNFGTIDYYRDISLKQSVKDGKELCEIIMSSLRTPLGDPYAGPIPDENKARALESRVQTDYMFNETDALGNCWLWIDIPAIRIDPAKASSLIGKQIRVKVRLLFNREIESICERCQPPDYCECELIVATICCEAGAGNCMFFPYVLQGLQDMNWSSGIAVTARGDLPADAFCELTLKDASGNKATYKNTNVSEIWTFVLDSIMSEFTGSTLIDGASSLEIRSNYSMDGYSYLDGGNFGAGVLPRGCGAGACAP